MHYTAFAYRQSENAPLQVCLVAPSCDIDSWARVPVRLSGRPHGFQRAEVPRHVDEIRQFFSSDETKTNSSPTAVLIGVSPEETDKIVLLNIDDGSEISQADFGREPRLCRVEIKFVPWDPSQFETRAEEIAALYSTLEVRLGSIVDDDEFEDVDDGDAVGATEDDDDEEEDFESDDEEMATAADSTFDESVDLSNLTVADLARICKAREYLDWSEVRQDELAELLRDERKPCLIIDGQHRISATKSLGEVPFLVSLLPTASWAELAFQFIVNNSSAKKVDDNLLFAIVGQSLEGDQLRSIEARLNRAGIKVSLIKASMRVQLEKNPFEGMLKTNTPGDPGFLDATAMQKKVISLWFGSRGRSGLRPTLKKFRAITDDPGQSREFSIADLFLANCTSGTKAERADEWQERLWFEYFSAFWDAIRDKYAADGLWPQSVDHWPPPQIKSDLTPEQRRVQNMMGATLLSMLQVSVLQRWAERRVDRLDVAEKLETSTITPEQFRKEVRQVVEPLSADFFLAYKRSGPDASKEVRQQFIRAAIAVLRGEKTVAAIKQTNDYFKND